MTNDILLEVKNLKKYYPITRGLFGRHAGDVRAVDGVSLFVREKEALGLVGESGCGKSTLGRTILRLEEPTSGQIVFQGKDITRLGAKDLRSFRGKAQMIFQDPQSSLDPRMMVGDSIGEALLIQGVKDEKERWNKVGRLLEKVGLEAEHSWRYPHEFSGGQKQRIGIARALAVSPKLIVADEPVSALDVSIQAQILNLLSDLQKDFGLSYIFIAHDLAVVRHISRRIAVMYLGRIVELCEGPELFRNPLHPYTEALLSAVPEPDPNVKKKRILLKGDVPPAANIPSGCRFHPRCHKRFEPCPTVEPHLFEYQPGRWVECLLYEKPTW